MDVLTKAKNPNDPRQRTTLAFAHARMGDAMKALDRPDEARKHWQTSLQIGAGAPGYNAADEVRERLAELDREENGSATRESTSSPN